MGVTKQAAQKRFVPKRSDHPEPGQGGIFGRFTGGARRVVAEAQEQARDARNDQVGSVHIALGLLHVPDTVAVRAIEAAGVTLDAARTAVSAVLDPPGAPIQGHLAFTPEAKQVLNLTTRHALRLGHNFVSTGHILLGVLADEDGKGAAGLTAAGLTRAAVEKAVVAFLAEGEPGE
jgi:ATP-dependent Clp protease ATP-binding subunit ClpA